METTDLVATIATYLPRYDYFQFRLVSREFLQAADRAVLFRLWWLQYTKIQPCAGHSNLLMACTALRGVCEGCDARSASNTQCFAPECDMVACDTCAIDLCQRCQLCLQLWCETCSSVRQCEDCGTTQCEDCCESVPCFNCY